MKRQTPAFLACGALLAASTLLFAQTAPQKVPKKAPPTSTSTMGTPVLVAPDTLKPGQYIWQPQTSPRGPMVLVISLPQQIAYVYRNGVLIGASTVSTGKKGKETPTGVFTILQKNVDHYSNIYNSAPMPYMQRLTWSGIAIHAGRLPGYPASQGCVRMPYDFAKLLYAQSSTGITVVVSDAKSFPTTVANPGLFAPIGTKGELATVPPRDGKYFTWQPELATKGPISILVTGADRSIRVFRNGEQIGWSVFTLQDPKRALTFQTYMALEEPGPTVVRRWQVVAPGAQVTALSASQLLQGVHVPQEFLTQLSKVIMPGTSLVVTQLAATGETTGPDFTVITADAPAGTNIGG
ncbi:MAG: L,D-transpeptidase [Pseudomonadota bacterium]